MLDPSRLPSQEQLEQLSEACRRDPASPAFVDLGAAYLSLGRPRDAVEVGARGLRSDPKNLEGRMMVSRALVALHQWKQAQAELLKVVKSNKNFGDGFRLLGEVLMRRADYDRALPVLQHAQNLDPANPAVLALLKRARAGQPLDPPKPIPTAREPRGARKPQLPPPRSSRPSRPPPPPPSLGDDDPTRVADDHAADLFEELDGASGSRDDATEQTFAVPELDEETGQIEQPASIRDRLPLPLAAAQSAPASRPPLPRPKPPAPKPPAPKPPAPKPRVKPPAPPQAASPADAQRVRPRILPAERKSGVAREPLRQSAEMGEDYLNNLLAAGLLDVPNVRVPDAPFDIKGEQRWRRGTRRAFIMLFTLLFVGTAGGTAWYLYAKGQRDADVARHLATAEELLVSAKYTELEKALDESRKALERDKSNVYSAAVFAEVSALSSLLYKTDPSDAQFAASSIRKEIDKGADGKRELLFANAALTLARLSEIEKPVDRLRDSRTAVEHWLETKPDDAWMRWLQARILLASGERAAAYKAFQQAEANNGPVVATIDRADMLLDDGDFDGAVKLYNAALARSANHPLALLGRSLARAERSVELAEAMDDLNVPLGRDKGPRVDSYKNLASAYNHYSLQHYEDFSKSLGKSIGVREPRFLARVAIGQLLLGKIEEAASARHKIRWYGAGKAETHPVVASLDADLYLALGMPSSAVAAIAKVEGLRARRVRAMALFDQGNYSDALEELGAALAIAPEDRELKVWNEAAQALTTKGSARKKALTRLDELRLDAKSKVASYVQGFVLRKLGKNKVARYALKKSLEKISLDEPNRLAYRSHVELAALALRANNAKSALEHLKASLEVNKGYLPTHALLGRMYLKQGSPAEAVGELQRVAEVAGVADAATELAYAEALVTQGGRSKKERAEDKVAAREAVLRAKEKNASAEELARVAALVADDKLFEELGIAAPEGAVPDKKKGKRRRGR